MNKTRILWNEKDMQEYEKEIGKKLITVDELHQKYERLEQALLDIKELMEDNIKDYNEGNIVRNITTLYDTLDIVNKALESGKNEKDS